MQKNITLSADQELIRKARERAQRENSTLNAAFRQWLKHYVGLGGKVADYWALMEMFSYAQPGGKFTRDEMNER